MTPPGLRVLPPYREGRPWWVRVFDGLAAVVDFTVLVGFAAWSAWVEWREQRRARRWPS